MSSMFLMRPIADGSFEYTSVDILPGEPEALSSLAWSSIPTLSELDPDYLSSHDTGLIIISDNLTHSWKLSPIILLAKGGLLWIRAIQREMHGLSMSWTTDKAIGVSKVPLPIPFVLNPGAPRLSVIGIFLVLLISGLFLRTYTQSELLQIETRSSQLVSEIEDYQQQLALQDHQFEVQLTDQTSSTQVHAMRGWASWLAANTLQQGALVGTIESYSSHWTPPLELTTPQPPAGIDWQLVIKDVTGIGLYRLVKYLEQINLGPVDVHLQDVPGQSADNLDDRPILIKGYYTIAGSGGDR